MHKKLKAKNPQEKKKVTQNEVPIMFNDEPHDPQIYQMTNGTNIQQQQMLDSYSMSNQQNLLSINDMTYNQALQPSNINNYSIPKISNDSDKQLKQVEMQQISQTKGSQNQQHQGNRQSTINADTPLVIKNNLVNVNHLEPSITAQNSNYNMMASKPEMFNQGVLNMNQNQYPVPLSTAGLLHGNTSDLPKTNFDFNLRHDGLCYCCFYERSNCSFQADKMFGVININRPINYCLEFKYCCQALYCFLCFCVYFKEVNTEKLNYKMQTQLSLDQKFAIQIDLTSAKKCLVSYKNIYLGSIELAKPRAAELLCAHKLGGTPVLLLHLERDNNDYIMHPEFTYCECMTTYFYLFRCFYKEKKIIIKQNNSLLSHQIMMTRSCIELLKHCFLPCCNPEFPQIHIKIENEIEEKKLLFFAGLIIIYEMYTHKRLFSDVFNGLV